MISKKMIELFLNKDFKFLGCNQPDIAIFFRICENRKVDICVLSDHTGGHIYTPSALHSLSKELERKFIFSGYHNISQHYILYTNNPLREKRFMESDISFWIYDIKDKQLIVYEDGCDDFCNLRADLENMLINPVSSEKKQSLSTRIKSLPIVTFTLLAINIIIFMILELFGSTNDSELMISSGALSWQHLFIKHEYLRLFTCTFLHFGIDHIINNMVSLSVIGAEIEKHLGHIRFIIIYVICGIGSSFISALYNMNVNYSSYTISAGASGAIFGLLGSLLIMSLLYASVRKKIKPANICIILFLLVLNGSQAENIDNVAHISGLLIGIIITFISCLCHKNVIK